MYRRILNWLNISGDDFPLLFLLIISAFGVGLFVSAFNIVSLALFLDAYSTRELPVAILFSGLVALISYPLVAGQFLQERVKMYAYYLILILGILTSVFFAGPMFFPHSRWYYAMLIFSIPINFLAYQIMQVIHRFFKTNDREKRFYFFTDLGYYGGMSAAGFGAILIILIRPKPLEVMSISFFGLVLAAMAQFFINRKQNTVPSSIRRIHAASYLNLYPSDLIKDKLTRFIFIAVLLSVISFWFIQFSFLSLVQTTYQNALGFTKFLGLFFGTLSAGLLFFKHVLVKRILNSYDSPYNIFVVPIVVFVLVVVALVIYLFLEQNSIVSRYSLFFILYASIKMVSVILQETVEKRAISLQLRIYEIPKCDIIDKFYQGPVRFLGTMVAAGLIYILIRFFSINYLVFTVFLGSCLLILGVANFFMLKYFHKNVRDFLKQISTSRKYLLNKVISLRERLYKLNLLDSPEKMLYTLKLAEDNYPADFRNNLYYLLGNSHEKVTEYALERIESLSVIQYQGQIERQSKRITNNYLKARFNKLSEIFSEYIKNSKDYTNVFKLVDSRLTENRILAANMLGSLKDPKLVSQLVLLLKDFRPEVKKAAFIAATNYRIRELTPIMLEHLSSTENYAYAYDVLLRIGEPSLEFLEKTFLDPKTDDRLLKRIVKLIGEYKSSKANTLLLSKIDYSSPEVSHQAIHSLLENGYIAKDSEKYRILNAIVKVNNALSKNIKFYSLLRSNPVDSQIIAAVKRDIDAAQQLIYNLLSLVYNRNIILRLMDYLDNEDLSGNHFGLEIIDNILDENIKSVLIPSFQYSTPSRKIKTLQYFYILEDLDIEDAFSELLTADSSQVSSYTRACVLQGILKQKNLKISQVIVSCLFHKEKLIQEAAACVLYINDPDLYYDVSERLDLNTKFYLDNAVEFYESRKSNLLLYKVDFLFKIPYFKSLRPAILVELSKYLEQNTLMKNATLTFDGEAWRYPILFILKGKIDLLQNGTIIFSLNESSVIDFGLFHETGKNKYTLKASEDSSFYTISREFLNLQIFDFPELEIVFQKIMNDFYDSFNRYKITKTDSNRELININ